MNRYGWACDPHRLPRTGRDFHRGGLTEDVGRRTRASHVAPTAITPLPVESAAAALAAVRSHDADYACVPIENSIDGSVLPTLDHLATGTPLQVFAELTLDVSFTIVVRPGTDAAPSRRWRPSPLPPRRY